MNKSKVREINCNFADFASGNDLQEHWWLIDLGIGQWLKDHVFIWIWLLLRQLQSWKSADVVKCDSFALLHSQTIFFEPLKPRTLLIYPRKMCIQKCTVFENHSKCRIWILALSTIFCPIKIDLSGNTVWPEASGFQKLAKIEHFWHF